MSDKFEFRKGNTLASYAEAISKMMEYQLLDTTQVRVPFDIITG